MNINEIQNKIMNFVDKRAESKNFKLTPELSYIKLSEEIGEVARQLTNKKMRPDLFDENNLKEEIVDVILESLILAHTCKVNLDEEITKKIDILFKKHNFKE